METVINNVLGIEEQPQLDRITIESRLQQLPSHIRPLDSQVAGHVNGGFAAFCRKVRGVCGLEHF
jgi:hypothetical protein